MDNDKTTKYRKSLDKKNFFNIVELRNMPKYFGWVNHCINNNLNVKLFLGGDDDGVALRCFWNNHYEEQTLKLWFELTNIEGIILDIGAHTGIYSLIANSSINKGAVFSFEPYYMNFARLNLNLRANSISTENAFMLAVGSEKGNLPFSVDTNADYLTSGGKLGAFSKKKIFSVQTITIDEFLDKEAQTHVKVIKIDVEGHEFQCLKGMEMTLSKSKPIIFFECISKTNTLLIENFLKNMNYKLFLIDDLNLKIKEVSTLEPYFDLDGKIIHTSINRIAIESSKMKLIQKFLT